MVTNLTLAQSNYPIQTIINGDTVVILTKKQADDINNIFENQKSKIDTLKKQLSSYRIQNQELNNQISTLSLFHDSVTKRLDILNHWLYWSAVDNVWMYYSYEDSSVMALDLTFYQMDLDAPTGNLLFINAPKEYRSEDYIKEQRDKKESPPLKWEFKIPEAIRPKITKIL
jgi:hypothetical protein